MSFPERVRVLVEPLVAADGLELYDLELAGGVLRVLVDRPGGVGLDDITGLTRDLSRALDQDDPLDGRYTLEVSSPGVERPLRTPTHFAAVVGATVKIKTVPGVEGDRRVEGTLSSTDADGIVVAGRDPGAEARSLRYDEIERARTVFEWGPTPKPGGPTRRTKRNAKAASPKAGAKKPAAKKHDKKVTSP
jgi:ribosome maturation factor RimP